MPGGLHRGGGEPERILGVDAGGDDPCQRLEPAGCGEGRGGENEGGRAVVEGGGVGGGDRAVGFERGAERGEFVVVDPLRTFVPVDAGGLAAGVDDLDRRDLAREQSGLLGGVCALERGDGILVLPGAGEAIARRAGFGAGAHVEIVVRIPEAIADERINDLLVTDAVTVAGLGQQVGG